MPKYVKASAIKRLARISGKRTSKAFIDAVDRHVYNCVMRGVATHNGGRKTLSNHVAMHIFGNQ
jgi:hypothetical protein